MPVSRSTWSTSSSTSGNVPTTSCGRGGAGRRYASVVRVTSTSLLNFAVVRTADYRFLSEGKWRPLVLFRCLLQLIVETFGIRKLTLVLDDTLCPPGRHVASLFCQHVAPELPGGRSWDDHREEVADLMIATVDRHAPGFAASVIGRQILSPLDLERQFGLLGGDIFHGALTLNQLFSARPMLGHADYRGPLKGLYHCGSGAHPGGGVTGAPGHNAARVILADHRALFG